MCHNRHFGVVLAGLRDTPTGQGYIFLLSYVFHLLEEGPMLIICIMLSDVNLHCLSV